MADMMGLDGETLAWMDTLWKTLENQGVCHLCESAKLFRQQNLEEKTGQGFYTYDSNGKIIS